jgi:WD40 repeat protein
MATPLSFLDRGNHLICWTAADNTLSERDLEANREIQSWPAPGGFQNQGFGLSPDERLGIAVGWRGAVAGRNLAGHSTTNLPLDVNEGYSGEFSADGKRFAVASPLGFARVWDTATWREEATLSGFLNAVLSVAFSPDGQRLATSGSNPEDAVKLWSADSWQEVLTLEGTGSMYFSTAFSPDGNAIGTLSNDGFLRIWQAPSWAGITAAEAKEKAETKSP